MISFSDKYNKADIRNVTQVKTLCIHDNFYSFDIDFCNTFWVGVNRLILWASTSSKIEEGLRI